jgi:H/ACA ribonucleoprotein complex subunit 4
MTKEKHKLPSDVKRKRLIKINTSSNPHYGKKPSERNITELLTAGLILIDKPSGPTSHQIDAWIKLILETKKIGHAGTLDPRVTGVLPIGIGRTTKALNVLTTAGKEYVGIMKLHKSISEKKIKETFSEFETKITQMPPVRSAVKRVRRKRNIYYLDLIEKNQNDVLFRVGCQAGTYIRTLCVDIGKKLKTGAHLADLRRTKVGGFIEKNCYNLHDLKDAYIFYKDEENIDFLKEIIMPIEKVLNPIPKIIIRDSAVDAICHGADLATPGVVEVDTGIQNDIQIAIMTLKGEAVAIGSSKLSTEEIIEKDTGICANVQRVLMNKGTYPSIWKKH